VSIIITPEAAAVLGKRHNPRDRDRSRDPLLGPPEDMAVSRVLLAELADMSPTHADQLAVKINDALKAVAGSVADTREAKRPDQSNPQGEQP